MVRKLISVLSDLTGNSTVIFSIVGVALVAAVGGSVDYMALSRAKSQVQATADAAVLVSARQLQLAGSDKTGTSKIDAIAGDYVKRNIDPTYTNVSWNVTVASDTRSVQLEISADVKTPFMAALGQPVKKTIKVTSTARLFAGLPLCVLSLGPNDQQGIGASQSARLTATGCSAQTNSTSSTAIEASESSELRTGLTCTAGGYIGGNANFFPVPTVDCPVIPDPLADRNPPNVGNCDYNDLEFISGNHFLDPGVYCGGIKITGDANVVFNEGVFVIKDGPLELTGNATVAGEYVGFYFTGKDSLFLAVDNAGVSLSAPKDGVMAGLLFFEDRKQTVMNTFEVTSKRARKLVGTIYVSKGVFEVNIPSGGNQKVADQSAFTVIIARKLLLRKGSNLVLNTDYAATDVPLPTTISDLSGHIALSK